MRLGKGYVDMCIKYLCVCVLGIYVCMLVCALGMCALYIYAS